MEPLRTQRLRAFTKRRRSKKSFQQHTQFSHFEKSVDFRVVELGKKFNRENSVEILFVKLCDQTSVVQLTQADLDLDLIWGAIAQLNMKDVRNQRVDASRIMRSAEIKTGVES